MMDGKVCCFLGHKKIDKSDELRKSLYNTIEELITQKNVDTFLFGSKSCFDSLCLEIVTEIKAKYPHIKRVYVRAEFPYIREHYKNYLLESYDDTYYPEKIIGAGRAVYVERNFEMIDNSRFCIFYYKEKAVPRARKSGTKIALDYAVKQGKHIIKLPAK